MKKDDQYTIAKIAGKKVLLHFRSIDYFSLNEP